MSNRNSNAASKLKNSVVAKKRNVETVYNPASSSSRHFLKSQSQPTKSAIPQRKHKVEKYSTTVSTAGYDIDERDKEDLISAAPYVLDIYEYYRSQEHRSVVSNYFERQPYIKPKMRAILVDYLICLHNKMDCGKFTCSSVEWLLEHGTNIPCVFLLLDAETLYLTTNIIRTLI